MKTKKLFAISLTVVPALLLILNAGQQYLPFLSSSFFWDRFSFLAAVLFLCLCLVFAWNILLHRKVRQRTVDLQRELKCRQQAEDRLREYQQELEQKVEQRTWELEQKNRLLTKAQDQLEQLSVTDSLTNLKNRRYLVQTIEQELARAKRERRTAQQSGMILASGLSFFMIDIDHFKRVNDLYGHEAGDTVLRQFSDILITVCRESDTLIRWGGEEFLVVVHAETIAQLTTLAERIRVATERNIFELSDGRVLRCTCSIGFSTYPYDLENPDGIEWDEVINLADRALYIAKTESRNAWVGVHATAVTETKAIRDAHYDLDSLVANGTLALTSSMTLAQMPGNSVGRTA